MHIGKLLSASRHVTAGHDPGCPDANTDCLLKNTDR